MGFKFNLTGLNNIYHESIKRKEPTIAFQINNGSGKFVFLMFFDKEDFDTYGQLFLLLKNTNRLLNFQLYGSRKNGDFNIFINNDHEDAIIAELQLNGNSTIPFVLEEFLISINSQIPQQLTLSSKIEKLKEVWSNIDVNLQKKLVDDFEATILKGKMVLRAPKKPQEKTLRKLYLYVEGSVEAKALFIEALKKANTTLEWTNDPAKAINFADIVLT